MGENKIKLSIELIPKTCQWSSVRSTLTTQQWDKIRKLSYEAAGNVCEICGESGKNQGYKHNVECHEIWEYDNKNHIQTLGGLISLCPICHQVKHIGRAIAMGKENDCFNQMAKVNKWTREQIQEHIVESFKLHKTRSKHKWGLDLSLLSKDPYNIELKENTERIFEVKKYKKVKKKKDPNAPKKIHPKAKIAAVLKPKKSTNKRPPKKGV
jgi:hypothetical protein